jgi:diguanylate cyclase (GGDEF)-like protein
VSAAPTATPEDSPADLRAEIARLNKIIDALVLRAEGATGMPHSGFGLLQSTVLLEKQVRVRTAELESVLRENERITRALRESEERLRDQATHDPLTGLYNRHAMDEALQRELVRARANRSPVAVIMADLDRFKSVNDTHGHRAGDEVLRAFGALILQRTRRGDVCCRYGGEEFLLILPGLGEQQAFARAEDLRNALACGSIHIEGATLRVTASFGLAVFPQHGATAQALIEAADQALYRAKENGRDRTERASVAAPVD